MSQNSQTHFKNLAAFGARFLKCVWPFWVLMQQRVKKRSSLSRDIQIYVVFSSLSTLSRFKKTNESGIIFYVVS